MAKDKKYKSVLEVDNALLTEIEELIHSRSEAVLKNILADLYNFDIAVIIDNLKRDEDAVYLFSLLSEETASEIILELRDEKRDAVVNSLSDSKLSSLLIEMDSDDATDLVADLDEDEQDKILKTLDVLDKEDSEEVRELLRYDENTAGGIMAKEYIAIGGENSVEDAFKLVQERGEDIDQFYNLWITDEGNCLQGIISLRRLIIAMKSPFDKLKDVMNPDVISVEANVDQEDVAKIFQSYDLVSLPVVDSDNRIIGKITIDDIVDVMEEEYSEDVAIMTGTDAEELEKKSSFQIAKLRLPWILITLGIELIAVFVIKSHDEILSKIILLAAFMPIISAISGNTGLQSAAIVIRALDTGYVNISKWWIPVIRQLKTTAIIGSVVGLIIGGIGYLMSDIDDVKFGLTVGISMFISINIAGLVGTVVPMLSKRLGFDPAITSGPFETAFQDVVGISIFLTIATFLFSHL